MAAVGLAGIMLTGCIGQTVVESHENVGNYNVAFSMDPQRLKPPQLATVSYAVTDSKTGKPVLDFEPVGGALMHNVLISRDLTYFKHSYSNLSQQDMFSLLTNFPIVGEYYSYNIFKPANGELEVLKSTIQAGGEGTAPELAVDTDRPKSAFGSQFSMLTGPNPLKAGQPSQLVVYVTERGVPVTQLWSFLGEPGYMWVIGSDGENFASEVGSAPGQIRPPSTPAGGETAVPDTGTGRMKAPPTLVPDVSNALATRTAQPVQELAPVQLTALASVLETPGVVVPSVGYGPYVAYTHVFPKAGLYKVWSEMQYRGQVLVLDWVVNVEP